MKNFEVKGSKILILGDSHKNTEWIKTILQKEKGNFDKIIHLGDHFDSFFDYPIVSSTKQTAHFVKEFINHQYGEVFQLTGNHELPLVESHKYCVQYTQPRNLQTICSGYTKNQAHDINSVLDQNDWQKFNPFYYCNGYLISHAGFNQYLWHNNLSFDENLAYAWDKGTKGLKDLLFTNNKVDEYFEVGISRGGSTDFPGIYWNDFDTEFIGVEGVKQILGHSSSFNHIRVKNENYCLDGSQTTYAILHDDGKLDLKSTKVSFALSIDGKTVQY